MAFCPRTPKWESQNSQTWDSPTTLGAHNFMCRLSIEMRSKAKLYPLSRTFQRYVARDLHAKKLGRFLTFSGEESNYQFNSRPFFCPVFWKFKNPPRLQFPKWYFTWECEGSFPHILLHSHEHEMWLPGSVLARTFVNPCLGHESKVRVMTLAQFL
jgi:hypothetical protein